MNGRLHTAFACLAAGVALPMCFTPTRADAQRSETVWVTVVTLRAPGSVDRSLGAKAADQVRDKLQDQFNKKDLYVVPTKDVANTLTQSGFDPNEALPSYEEKSLANLLRSEYYVTGTVTQVDPNTVRLDGRLVVTRGDNRDAPISQPIPTAQGRKLDQAAEAFAKSIRDALKQAPAEKACAAKARVGNLEDAVTAGRGAIALYPQSTLARMCIAMVRYSQYSKATAQADSTRYADSTLAVVNEVLYYDSASIPALKMATELYKFRGDSAKSRQYALALIDADPSNNTLREQVINELAASGHADEAVPLVQKLLEANPGDPNSLRTAFLVYVNAGKWQDAVNTGPEVARVDTSFADVTYFVRMAVAYDKLKQPQRAAEVLAQGTAKYPNDTELWVAYAKYLNDAGQTQQSIDAYKHAVTLGSPVAVQQLLAMYNDQKLNDSVYVLSQQVATMSGATPELKQAASRFNLRIASVCSQKAAQSKADADYDCAIKYATLADQLDPSETPKFIIGTSYLSMAQNRLTAANEGKSCSLARSANEAVGGAKAPLNTLAALPASSTYGPRAKDLLKFHTQMETVAAAQIKQFCK